jgi:N-acetylglucosamine malate deacetylase 1
MARVLVVSPHPDDESIGSGGTLRDHVVRGDEVRAIFLTSGESGGHGAPVHETAQVREREAEAAATILGLAHEPDGAVRVTRALVRRLAEALQLWRPEIVYVTHDREMHPDHRAAARLVRRAVSEGGPVMSGVTIRMSEVWTPLQRIDHVVDITPHLAAKLAAIRAHASQCAVLRFDEAARGLSRYRGAMHSWYGVTHAEIFAEPSW